MADFSEKVVLGRTGLRVSRLGLGASFAAPTASYEEAFEHGVNYFYWGSRRRTAMGKALQQILPKHRSDVVLVLQSYTRVASLLRPFVEWGLKRLGTDYADVLLLGWFNSPPAPRILDAAQALVDQGMVRHIALSSHRRTLFPQLLNDQHYAAWHLRYNAVHRGAEREVFPVLAAVDHAERPGVVTYTTTRWGHLCDPKRTRPGERTPDGTDCLRFVLSRPEVDVAISGPNSADHMRQALRALELGPMSADELGWMRRVGDHIYGRDATSSVRDGA